MLDTLLSGLIGLSLGAVTIAGALHVAFRLTGKTVPTFGNLLKAALAACVMVYVAGALASGLLPGALASIAAFAFGLAGAFLAYDRLLTTPEGAPMGRGDATLALATHFGFSLAMLLLIFPLLSAILG